MPDPENIQQFHIHIFSPSSLFSKKVHPETDWMLYKSTYPIFSMNNI